MILTLECAQRTSQSFFFFHTAEVRMRNPISRVPSKRRQINNKPVTQFSGGATALPEANSDFNSRVSQ